jgi:tetratricopeptide (TPR) repeat protein
VIGRQLLGLAEEQGDASLQVDGELVLGASLAFLGDVAVGMEHLERAMALFDPQRHLEGRFRFGTSPGVVAHTTSALLEWLRGNPDRSTELAGRAVELAQELNHPFSTAYTLFHVGILDLWRRKPSLAHERAGGVLDVAEEHGYQIWKALALMLRGAATAELGRPEEGITDIERGVDLYQGLTTPPVFWPLVLSIHARALALGGRPADGLRLIDEAAELGGPDAVMYPAFALLRAELLIGLGDTESAAQQLQEAVDASGRFGLRMPQLRAATLLARLQHGRAEDSLREIYETFTEGLDDPDLVDARAVLEGLLSPTGDQRIPGHL